MSFCLAVDELAEGETLATRDLVALIFRSWDLACLPLSGGRTYHP